MGLRTFTFGGTSSSTYSMFITEAATYNVPERAVEMMEIPGRNGAFALDQGRFENVEVTYHVVVHKDTNANFQTELSDVRNWLASKVGYQRLTDDYNSNVYRMAIFKGGLETDETFVNGAEFDIVFECKPQRWLTSGETATAVANNGTLSNPTKFDAEPLLAVKGYGTIDFNGYEIEIANATIGETLLLNSYSHIITTTNTVQNSFTTTFTFDIPTQNVMQVGDTITMRNLTLEYIVVLDTNNASNIGATTVADSNSSFSSTLTAGPTFNRKSIKTNGTNLGFSAFTASTITNTTTITGVISGTTYKSTLSTTLALDANNTMTVTFVFAQTSGTKVFFVSKGEANFLNIYGDSSLSALGNPTYIDCDIGECWMESGGIITTLNNVIDLGSDLPKLASGTNTFTYDNTVTELKVTPRWWKI